MPHVRTALLVPLLAVTSIATAAPPADTAPTARVVLDEASRHSQRRALPAHFRAAYARYPAIPAGTLEAIAYVQSRWSHLRPASPTQAGAHHHMPAAHGVMGLYGGEGFRDQLADGARLIGVPRTRVRDDVRSNVLAAAALLDAELKRDARLRTAARATPEDIAPALMRYAGTGADTADTRIGDYARSSFAFDVLLAQDRGIDEDGMRVPMRAIEWERAFDLKRLSALRAPMVRLDAARDRIEVAGIAIDPISETVRTAPARGTDVGIQSTDYGPALWVASPYFGTRSSYSSTTIHTAQGSYAGTINWFKSNPYSVSAHYVIRSSDGQVTQMVRNANSAHHVGVHNATTLGIEHEGFIDNASWYTTAMYNASAALVRNFCSKYSAITCANAYKGPAHSTVVVLPTSVDIKGHQHYTQQDHTDPGIHWDWARYYALLNPGSGTRILDSFESSVGHYNTPVTYSGSTVGVSTASEKTRDCTTRKNGSCSLRLLLKDNTASSSDWAVRLLSHSGDPASNIALQKGGGRVGFWVYAAGSGVSVAAAVDDSDGTERSNAKAITPNTWTYITWQLDLAADWNAWAGGDGAITASTVKLDALWFFHANTASDINVYVDDVQTSN